MTKEIVFDPARLQYFIRTPYCAYFSGMPDEQVILSNRITLEVRNRRITLALLPVREEPLADAKEYLLTAMGNTGMDKTVYQPGPERMGRAFTTVILEGKLYAETLEGMLYVKARGAELEILSPAGDILAKKTGCRSHRGICFALKGELPSVQYHLSIIL